MKEEFVVERKIEEVINEMDIDRFLSLFQIELPAVMRQLKMIGALVGLLFGIVQVMYVFIT